MVLTFQVKKENPGAQLKDICNILGMKWKNLSAKEKKPYEEKHLAEKEFCLQIIRKESEKKRVLIKEEQRQKAAMELLEQYLLFRKVTRDLLTHKNIWVFSIPCARKRWSWPNIYYRKLIKRARGPEQNEIHQNPSSLCQHSSCSWVSVNLHFLQRKRMLLKLK